MEFALLLALILLAGCAGTNRPPEYKPPSLTEISILTPGTQIQKLAGETAEDSTGGNMAWGVTKGILIGIVTLGLYVPIPIPNSSTLYFILFDNTKRKIAYDISEHTQDSPKDSENPEAQITRIISKLKT